MHIEIQKSVLEKSLDLISRISVKHQTLPVLQCVYIDVAEKITFRATNLEIGIEACVDGVVKEKGVLAVPAAILFQTTQLLSNEVITLKASGDVLEVVSQKGKTVIKTLPHEEFPHIPRIEGTPQTLNREIFSLGIKTTAFSVSQSSIKPELGSIYIHQKKEHSLTFVATDSFRLMEKTVPQKNVVLDEGVMIPQKNALELARICDQEDSDPEMYISENQLGLQFKDGVYITSRLTEGTFPDYEGIIPKEFKTHATVLREDLTLTLKKTNIFTNKFMQVHLDVDPSGKKIIFSAQNNDFGNTEEAISAQIEGEGLALNFNQRYLNEPLSHTSDESLTLHFAGIGRPLVCTGVSDASFRYLVMPMNK